MTSLCPTDALLKEFVQGLLSDEEAQSIDTHIEQCDACTDTLERMNGSPGGLLGLAAHLHQDTFDSDSPETIQIPGYEIRERIGGGGMGVVFRAKNHQLGRTLAIKVLRRELCHIAELRERFQKEARINARLQHPCIAPVHEAGLTSDGRPFFSMKLVSGETLQRRLTGRIDNQNDSADLIRIIGLVCQGVGYAHVHSVIHRDLKPDNIMLGAFGEVQVMDWGLAKSIEPTMPEHEVNEDWDRSIDVAYQTHRALGTYAYMPPEQARAQIDLQDARSDVFSLGAILCQILTGEPAYAESGVLSVKQQAETSQLAPAFRRLDLCGADPGLIHLAKSCLAPRPEDRPKSAVELAERISAYQNDVEERLRQAELQRAAAVTRAAEQKKRWRLNLALAGSLLTLAGILCGVAWWQHSLKVQKLAERSEQTRRTVAVLDQVQFHLQAGAWTAAAAAMDQISPHVLKSSEAFVAMRADQTRRHLAFALKLLELDEDRWALLEKTITPEEFHRRYQDCFESSGFNILSESEEQIANQIADSAIHSTILAALDRWMEFLSDGPTFRRLAQVALLSESRKDAWTQKARDPQNLEQVDKIAQVIAETPWQQVTPSLALLLAGRLQAQGGDAKRYLLEAQKHFPDDYWINAMLGRVILGSSAGLTADPQSAAESVGYFRAALVKRPHSVAAKSNLGLALSSSGAYRESLQLLQEAATALPENAVVHLNLGIVLEQTGELEAALASYRRAVERNPRHANAQFRLGMTLTKLRRFEDAGAAFQTCLELEPNAADACSALADTYLFRNDFLQAISYYRRTLSFDQQLPKTWGNLSIALRNIGQLDEAISAANQAVSLGPDRKAYVILGNAHQAKGNFQEASAAFQRAQTFSP